MTTETISPEQAQAKKVISVMSMLLNRAYISMNKSDEAVDKFTKEIQGENPAYAFRWANDAMRDIAYGSVSKHFHQALTNGSNVWDLRETFRDKLMHSAKYPSFSTSPTSDLMATFTTSGVAEWLEIIEHAIVFLEAAGVTRPSTTDEA